MRASLMLGTSQQRAEAEIPASPVTFSISLASAGPRAPLDNSINCSSFDSLSIDAQLRRHSVFLQAAELPHSSPGVMNKRECF